MDKPGILTLKRFESTDEGTFGRLSGHGLDLWTGELPWRDNKSDISCIPAGMYQCTMTYSARFKKRLYLVSGSHYRVGIRIHAANLCGDRQKGYTSQLNGCIAVGEKFGKIAGQKAVLVSQAAIRKLHEAMKDEPFFLEIIDVNALGHITSPG